MSTPVTVADIAAACGAAERTVRNWTERPEWPAGKRKGQSGALTWDIDALPESITLRGKKIRIRARLSARRAIQAVRAANPKALKSADESFLLVVAGEVFEVRRKA